MPSAVFHIRRFKPSDLIGMYAVRRSAICDIAARDYSPSQIAAWVGGDDDHVARLARFVGSLTWAAEQGGEIIGFTNLAEGGYLDCLYVHGAHQRKGVAQSLFQALKVAATDRGERRLHSQVSLTARGFFERQGFIVTTPETVRSNGQAYLVFQMEKPLQ
jgi:putative acetyltransferase